VKIPRFLRPLLLIFILGSAPSATRANDLQWNGGVSGSWQNGGSGWLDGGSAATWNNSNPDSASFTGTTPTSVSVSTVTAGSLTFSSGNYTFTNGTLTLSGNSSINVGSSLQATFNSAIQGSSGLVKVGTGTLTLNGTNKTYTGGTTINAGAIRISSAAAGALGSAANSTLTLNGGALHANFASNTTPSFAITIGASGGEIRNINSAGRYLFGSNVLNGNGTLTISFGSGAVRVGATGTGTTQTGFSGKWIVDGNGGNATNGFLDVYAEQNFGTGSGDDFLTLQNGAKVLMRGMSFTKGITIGSAGGQIANSGGGNTSISGKISGASGNDLTLDLGGSATSNITLSNTANSWSGNTTLSTAGNLRLGASGVLPDAAGNIIFANASAVLDMKGFNETVGGISGNGTIDNTAASTSSTLDVGGNNLATTFSGVIRNTGAGSSLALSKSGSNSLTLSGNNSYSGGTTVTGGTLILTNANALGSGNLALNASGAQRAILRLDGLTINGKTLTMNSSINRSQLISTAATAATWNGTITLEGSVSGNGSPELTDSGAGGKLLVQGSIGGSLTNGSLTLRGANNSNELAATISIGSTDITKTDSNTWTISSTGNTWGNTSIQMGTLRVGAANALASTTIVSIGSGSNNGTLDLGSGASSYSQTIGGLNTSSASTAANQKITNSSSGSGTAVLTIDTSISNTFGGLIEDGATAKIALVKSGTGSLSLSGSNSYSGGTTVAGGTLVLTNSNALGGGNITLSSSNATGSGNRAILQLAGISVNGTTLTMNSSTNRAQLISSAATAATWNGTITLEGSVGANGSPELTDSGAGGKLLVQGSIGGSLTGGSLTLRGVNNSNELAATISIGSTDLTKNDNNIWTISSTGNTWGNTYIQFGTLRTGAANALASTTIVSIGSGSNNGTLDLGSGASSYSQTIGGLNTSSASTAANQKITNSSSGSGTATLTVDTAVSNTFGGMIQDGATAKVALVKSGSGNLTLSGNNSYSGGTTINTGTFVIGQANAAGSGTITQTDGTSLLKLDTTGTIANAMSIYNVSANKTVTLSGGITVNNATFDVASGETLTISNTINGTGGVTKNGSGTLVLSGNNTYSAPTIINSGTLEAANAGALGSNNTVQVTGGSLLVSANGSLNNKSVTLNSTSITVAGLAFSGNYSGLVDNLTLSKNSIIDLGEGSVSIMFDTFVMGAYMLDIYNWSGTTLWNGGTGNDTDKVYFGPDLSDEALAKIRFHSGAVGVGDSFLGTGFDLGFQPTSFDSGLSGYHIIPVPEPETWATGIMLLLGGAVWMWKRKRKLALDC
jgi:fibronectin-binding autotransporter adhesin